MDVHRFFRPEDLEAIRAAVAAAEAKSGGEIVTYAVGRCDPYEEARWRGAAAGAVVAAVAAGFLHPLVEIWGGWGAVWVALPAVVGAAAGYLAAWGWPALERLLVDAETREHRVRQRAQTAFLDEEVFATRDRTGVLLFLALFERRVEVLADAGIHARVAPGEWEQIAADLAAGIRRGEAAAALIAAVGRCGRLLEERGVARRPDDADELADEPRLSDE
jgi:putative membrane protein